MLFDLEIVFLMFLPQLGGAIEAPGLRKMAIYFVVFLYLRLIYEWADGTLEWVS